MPQKTLLKPFERIWTFEEEEVLKANYLDYNQRQLQQKFFPDKTVRQVLDKKMHMRLTGRRRWSESERALLLEHGANYTHKEMVEKFLPNKTPRQVTSMRKYFGIYRRKANNQLPPKNSNN